MFSSNNLNLPKEPKESFARSPSNNLNLPKDIPQDYLGLGQLF